MDSILSVSGSSGGSDKNSNTRAKRDAKPTDALDKAIRTSNIQLATIVQKKKRLGKKKHKNTKYNYYSRTISLAPC
jgi:hypothetical protein